MYSKKLNLKIIECSMCCYYPHIADEETEAQRSKIIFPGQGHITSKWESQDLCTDSGTPEPIGLITVLCCLV